MKIFILFLNTVIISYGSEKPEKIDNQKSNIYAKLLSEQLVGEYADYKNSSPEWRLVMEARIRSAIFTYWINIDKFKVMRSKSVEKRFGELSLLITVSGKFDQTFIKPNFLKNKKPFQKHGYISDEGERFEILSYLDFEIENKKFLEFLKTCEKL